MRINAGALQNGLRHQTKEMRRALKESQRAMCMAGWHPLLLLLRYILEGTCNGRSFARPSLHTQRPFITTFHRGVIARERGNIE